MNTRVEEAPRQRGAKSTALHERVAHYYYAHGLFCTSYPTTAITVAILIVVICCYPLLNLPLSGNLAVRVWNNGSVGVGQSQKGGDPPKYYVQQVVLRSAVVPWTAALNVGDAFRAPLYEAFKLLDIVRNYQDPISLKTLGHVCLHVEAIKKAKDPKNDVLPEYSCLVLSPANLWKQDVQLFVQDTSILNTIYSHQNLQKGKTSIAEMLFGMHLVDSGIKRYPLRNRQRVIQYAVTLFFTDYDERFISGLREKLHTHYPLHQHSNESDRSEHQPYLNDTVLIYYPGEINVFEFVPLMVAYTLLFFYYYFSVRKIELINSKIGMAFSVVVTILCSLSMTLGLCFFFGLTLSLHSKQVFPYLVILVGLENVLVLTKSVVSTPSHLDIKIRVAQGLSKEGWSITKNLLIEITILTMGIFTFVPAIQEFCIFAIVGLIVDFFLQMLFFSTVLGIDTRNMEKSEKTNLEFRNNLYQAHGYEKIATTGMNRSKSHPRLNSMHTNVVAGQTQGKQDKKIPKRLRLVNIWARTRFFQRAFMILMVVWIGMILYNSGIVEQYLLDLNGDVERRETRNESSKEVKFDVLPILNDNDSYMANYVTQKSGDVNYERNVDELNKLRHGEYRPWLGLSTQHWPSILRKYNVSVSGEHIAVLPNIKISHAVAPEQAVLLRNHDEKYGQTFEWRALALALDPIDFNDIEGSGGSYLPQSDRPFYPTSPMEIFLTAILCGISVIVVAYTVFVLYKVICSRNYAEWRASWSAEKSGDESDVPVLLEAVPVVLDGHKQEIECMATDGFSIVSSCLGGQLKVWDIVTGEIITGIDRKRFGMCPSKSPDQSIEYDENAYSDYESGSPPSRDENLISFPSLQKKINTNFANLKLEPIAAMSKSRFDFGDDYRQLYLNHDTSRLRHRSSETVKWVQHQRGMLDAVDGFCGGGDVGRSKAIDIQRSGREPRELFGGGGGSPISPCNNLGSGDGKVPPIWCIDFVDNLIVIGCADGRLEFWEGTTAKFKCMYEDGSGVGITAVKIVGSRVVAARLYGGLDFLQLQTYNQGRPIDWNFTSAYRRTHIRTGSAGSISDYVHSPKNDDVKEDMRCLKVLSTKAHQQPITCLDCEGGRVLTGSQDHTLKVFRLEDGSHLYTLHGHCGPISCLFIDRVSPATSGSGSQDGMLCVWDLLTGACMYSIQAHDGSITSLTYSASYVISLGSDDRMCVWERFQGHLLNTIHVNGTFTSQVLMLTSHLVVTSRSGGLVLWDVRSGESVKSIVLGHSPYVFVKQLLILRDAVLCDFGKELRIVRFPLITHKYD